MKFRVLTALACASALGFTAGAAQAAVTFVGYDTAIGAGETLVTEFEGGPTLAGVDFLLAGFSLTGNGILFTGSQANLSAAPGFSATTQDTSQYLSIGRGQSVTLDTPLLKSISFYVGSLDSFNSFKFKLANGTVETITGSTLAALPGLDANGSWTGFTSNGRITFSFDSAIDSVELASGNYAFEISDISVISAVPEPAAWGMMILGFGGVGGLIRRRKTSFAMA